MAKELGRLKRHIEIVHKGTGGRTAGSFPWRAIFCSVSMKENNYAFKESGAEGTDGYI